MKTEVLSVQDAIEQGSHLPYAMVRSLSQVTLGKTPHNIDCGELLEARFFNSNKEIRVFRRESSLCAAILTETAEPVRKTFLLANPQFGAQVTVSYDLDSDEDGQTYVCSARLSDWKGGECNA